MGTRKYMPTRPVVAAAAERVGLRKAFSVGLFIAVWRVFTVANGRPPATVDEFAKWCNISRAQAFRDQALFREAFPDFSTPTEVWAALVEPPPVTVTDPADVGDVVGDVLAARIAS
jgi:hypothetical protein